MHKVVQTIIHYEPRGFSNIIIDWTDEFFPYKNDAHENGWDCFFEPIILTNKKTDQLSEKVVVDSSAQFHEMHDQVCTAPWISYQQFLPYRQHIHDVINQYCRLKSNIKNEVEKKYVQLINGKMAIGVHARIARAHAWLVPGKRLPTLQDYFAEVDRLLKKHKNDDVVIFVASDSHAAIDSFKERYGERAVSIEAFRSAQDQDPCIMYTKGQYMKEHPDVWHQEKHGYFGGVTTLLDCLLLSRCDYMIHTTSNLAFFACYYNPMLKTIYLPKAVPAKTCRFKGKMECTNPHLNPE